MFVTAPLTLSSETPRRTRAASKGEPAKTLITKIAGTRKGSSVPPHGHQNMVSAFLVISGEYQVIQYNKEGVDGQLEPGKGSLIVRELSSEKQRKGQWSSISDDKSNVHWLRGLSDDCFFFSSKIIQLRENQETHGRINIDVKNSQKLSDSRLKCPIIDAKRAETIFG